MPFDEMDFAKLDGHRAIRNGFSEVIYCQNKTNDQVVTIAGKMIEKGSNVFGTRASIELGAEIRNEFKNAEHDALSATFQIIAHDVTPLSGKVAILAAGTADLKVAEEAKRTLNFFGAEAKTYYDVGVAGIHRLFAQIKGLEEYDCLIAIAGMEGALPSVVGGLISKPIVAVPTSVGYGANFGGITPLLAMLNSCSEGITVVNIDNGFGAACAALRIINS
ncbi:MAG: nickel pincer cofactor biosynthesis protein LarB [Deltaproteobacteria bacterium]|nr:nickel pincer cofactor biosynthesis protein LarB [Deltaproteobacteria bacterium]